ncbi:uncharacterized protein LOC128955422 [Oppia nitens]|uniref:uncharacterized protein LOC128955422 n=1 Tax=Oppia nitens TaxID=1686743 RepID=UPI0023DA303A|nr:uncharacterized protein LOC128955422 [Oppia nitens]
MTNKYDLLSKPSLANRLYNRLIRETIYPTIAILLSPIVVMMATYIVVIKNSYLKRALIPLTTTAKLTVLEAYHSIKWSDLECWSVVGGLILWGIISLHFPGRKYHGPPTPNGYRPEYWHSGFKYYIISMIIICPLIWKYSVLHLYYKIPNLMAILILFGIIFVFILYLKGLVFPDPGVCDITKNPIFDFYWGIELYPHLGPFVSLKVLIVSRFGMFLWQLLALVAWKANYELYIASYNRGHINWPLTTNVLLTSLYLAFKFYTEDNYMQSFDAIHDRFGFYLAWGSIAFLPGIYSLSSIYLVKHSPMEQFGLLSALVVLCLGAIAIYLTYCVDSQRSHCRQTNGKCNIWGQPAKVIRATYLDNYGITKRTVLLASGYWGIARHINYTFEILATFAICCPSLLTSPIPYIHLATVVAMLLHRTHRDNQRCAKKYGSHWKEYCQMVSYKMIPGLF